MPVLTNYDHDACDLNVELTDSFLSWLVIQQAMTAVSR